MQWLANLIKPCFIHNGIYKRFSFFIFKNFKPYIFSLMAATHLKVGTGETKGFF